jgi:hypothetical protein
MSRATNLAVSIAIWAVGLIPAVAIAIWLGMVEATWLGAVKAVVIVTAIVAVFELFQRWVARLLASRKGGAS